MVKGIEAGSLLGTLRLQRTQLRLRGFRFKPSSFRQSIIFAQAAGYIIFVQDAEYPTCKAWDTKLDVTFFLQLVQD